MLYNNIFVSLKWNFLMMFDDLFDDVLILFAESWQC